MYVIQLCSDTGTACVSCSSFTCSINMLAVTGGSKWSYVDFFRENPLLFRLVGKPHLNYPCLGNSTTGSCVSVLHSDI
jgi:hypothetical protein